MKMNLAKKVQNKEGFTLIELMIVVAIIGILAAIAIPNFISYQLKAKTAESKTNLGAIKTSQEAYKAEWDFYLVCAANPVASTVSDVKRPFTVAANDGFSNIGFVPSGDVYYTYEVAVGGGTASADVAGSSLAGNSGAFAASALGDLDGNAADATEMGQFVYASDIAGVATTGTVGTATSSGVVQDVNVGQY